MYRQWCKNLRNFIDYNTTERPGIRLKLAEELLFLTDIEAYKRSKMCNSPVYWNAVAFINQLRSYQEEYPSIEKFLWELWGYGFDIIDGVETETDNTGVMEEKVKIIDLLYGIQYM